MWKGEYDKAQINNFTNEGLSQEFHSGLYSFSELVIPLVLSDLWRKLFFLPSFCLFGQMGVVDLIDCLHRYTDLQPNSASNCALCGVLPLPLPKEDISSHEVLSMAVGDEFHATE